MGGRWRAAAWIDEASILDRWMDSRSGRIVTLYSLKEPLRAAGYVATVEAHNGSLRRSVLFVVDGRNIVSVKLGDEDRVLKQRRRAGWMPAAPTLTPQAISRAAVNEA